MVLSSFNFFVVGCERRIFSGTECVSAVQGHPPKVVDFGTNRKGVCGFLLVINSSFGPILHRFWDTASYWLKIANFAYPTLVWCPRSAGSRQNSPVWRTDGQTDGIPIAYARLAYAVARKNSPLTSCVELRRHEQCKQRGVIVLAVKMPDRISISLP